MDNLSREGSGATTAGSDGRGATAAEQPSLLPLAAAQDTPIEVRPPAGMVVVSRDAFYACIGQLDVHPHPEREYVEWVTPRREVVGRTLPGYIPKGPEVYMLLKRMAGHSGS